METGIDINQQQNLGSQHNMDNYQVFDAIRNITKDVDIFKGGTDQLYEQLLNTASERVEVSPYVIEEAMEMIAYHESLGVIDKEQKGGGPGRGLFQYELLTNNGSGAGRAAMNRLYTYLGGDLISGTEPSVFPGWMEKYFPENTSGRRDPSKIDVDFSKLDEKQQKVLFMADKLMAGDTSFEGISDNWNALSKWWYKNHYKGTDEGHLKDFTDKRFFYSANKINKNLGIY
jgi:hypothetical protein